MHACPVHFLELLHVAVRVGNLSGHGQDSDRDPCATNAALINPFVNPVFTGLS
jgi:hypothetical protein